MLRKSLRYAVLTSEDIYVGHWSVFVGVWNVGSLSLDSNPSQISNNLISPESDLGDGRSQESVFITLLVPISSWTITYQ